jgi:hypothetical protein
LPSARAICAIGKQADNSVANRRAEGRFAWHDHGMSTNTAREREPKMSLGRLSQERIGRWLSRALDVAPTEGGVAITLHHAAVDQRQRVLQTWKLDQLPAEEREIGALVSAIDERAQSDAEELGGMQRYVLQAHISGREMGSLTVRYNTSPSPAPGAFDSEPATPAGVVATMQRHAEGSTRMLLEGYGTIVQSFRDQLATQGELLARYQAQQAQMFDMQEALVNRLSERELELQEHRMLAELTIAREKAEMQAKSTMMSEGIQLLRMAGPMLLWHLTKGKVGMDPAKFAEEYAARAAAEAEGTSAARAGTPPTGGQPANTNARPDGQPASRALLIFGSTLYTELVKNRQTLTALTGPLMVGQPWQGLPEADRRIIGSLAAVCFGSVIPGAPEIGEADAGTILWQGLCAVGAARLVPLVQIVGAGREWSALGQDAKVAVLKAAREIYEAADAAAQGLDAPPESTRATEVKT